MLSEEGYAGLAEAAAGTQTEGDLELPAEGDLELPAAAVIANGNSAANASFTSVSAANASKSSKTSWLSEYENSKASFDTVGEDEEE